MNGSPLKYRIYIDETGNADLASSDNPNHRFLSLTGVILELTYVDRTVHPEMEGLKREFFGHHADDPVVFHRKEMVNRLGRFRVLKDPDVEAAFNESLLGVLRNWEYSVITVLLDKREHRDKYHAWKYDPYHYCLAVLLERFLFFLSRAETHGDVMIESRGSKLDRRLKESFRALVEKGSDFIEAARFAESLTSCEIKVKPKQANIAGLQLADLVAHPSRRDALRVFGLYTEVQGRRRPFGEQISEILVDKYERYRGTIAGSGLKKLP